MVWRLAAIAMLVASACGGARAVEPSQPPAVDGAMAAVPAGPILFEPEQLIYPPEEFPLKDVAVTRDTPIAPHAWERDLETPSSVDFRWFAIRLFVLEPDLTGSRFVLDNGCGTVTWAEEQPVSAELDPPRTGEAARACRYTFRDGSRVLYLVTGYKNVGLLVGTQPRRSEMGDDLALRWLSAIGQKQIGIIGRVFATAK